MPARFHVLVLSPGAKFGLVRALAEAVAWRDGRLTGWESDGASPALGLCHDRAKGGPVEGEGAVAELLHWCTDNGVNLVVPTRHDDLPSLAAARDRFAAAGVSIAVSSPECIRICHNKGETHAWLSSRGFPVPAQTTVADLGTSALATQFPLIAKHPQGSGSRSVRTCSSLADLGGLPADWIVQSLAPGREHTINTYVDRRGRSVCEIPHERLLVAEGEVVRGRTVRVDALTDLARGIAEQLPGAGGPINIQIYWETETGRATVIEINPRFGGGYPLAHRAGGKFVDWLLLEHIEHIPLNRRDDWEADLLMVRYREAMFFPERTMG
jgi:carbamoyl-phosphate synthase large subunit